MSDMKLLNAKLINEVKNLKSSLKEKETHLDDIKNKYTDIENENSALKENLKNSKFLKEI
jgi:predicted nuclease with TOPRIM domain